MWLELLRKERGWSQATLAAKVADRLGDKFPQVAVSRIERGERALALPELQALAAVAGLSVLEVATLALGAGGEASPQSVALGRWVAAQRTARGWSLEQLAERLEGVSAVLLGRMESGQVEVRLDVVHGLAEVFNVSVAEVVAQGNPSASAMRAKCARYAKQIGALSDRLQTEAGRLQRLAGEFAVDYYSADAAGRRALRAAVESGLPEGSSEDIYDAVGDFVRVFFDESVAHSPRAGFEALRDLG